jgi:hypothetical protein
MPQYILFIKAELQHVKSFRPKEGARFCVDLTSGSETRSGVWIDPNVQVDAPGGRSETNLVISFEGVKSQATVDIVSCSEVATEYKEENSGQWVAIQCFECRGCEVAAYTPGDDWIVVGESGQEFDEGKVIRVLYFLFTIL